jgi:hypothetical protein
MTGRKEIVKEKRRKRGPGPLFFRFSEIGKKTRG